MCRSFSAGGERRKGRFFVATLLAMLGRINRLFVANCLPPLRGEAIGRLLENGQVRKGTARAVPFVVQFADRLVVAVMPLWLTPMVVVPVAKVVARPAWIGALAMVATVGTVELQ